MSDTPKYPAACAFHPLARVVEAVEHERVVAYAVALKDELIRLLDVVGEEDDASIRRVIEFHPAAPSLSLPAGANQPADAELFARHIASGGVGHPSGDPRVLLCIECGARGRNRPSVPHAPDCIVGKAQAFVAAHSSVTEEESAALANGEIPARLAQPDCVHEIGDARDYDPQDLLHILRNPWNWSDEAVRAARLAAADIVESHQRCDSSAVAALRELVRQIDAFAEKNGEADFYVGDALKVLEAHRIFKEKE